MLEVKKRRIVRADINWVEGYALEEIPMDYKGKRKGIVLVCSEWDDQYFLNIRTGWDDEDYFKLAETRFQDLGIEKH